MICVNLLHNDELDAERLRAIATARMVYYTSREASELGLGECSQLLYFVADLIRMKFNIQDDEAFLDHKERIRSSN